MSFSDMNIDDKLYKAINELGFEKPTEIQKKSIPYILRGKDIIAGSHTGSGKTLAFGAGIISKISRKDIVGALVLTPTRELAVQVKESLQNYSKYKELYIVSVYGGVSIEPQINHLKNANVVVGTPGRVLDHINRGTLNLGNIKILVLDEADRMLDMGFLNDVELIMSKCNEDKQTLLFSATLSKELMDISRKYMKDSVNISLNNQVDASKLEQVYYDVPGHLKFSLLVKEIKKNGSKSMVFCNSKKSVDEVSEGLYRNRIKAKGLHGGLTQAKRSKVLRAFNKGDLDVLVCTDVAARGLDIEGVEYVYNYDVPQDKKQYVHRIGRTARAGKKGKAITLLSRKDYSYFDNIVEIMDKKNIKISKLKLPYIEKINTNRYINKNDFRKTFKKESYGKGYFY